MISCFMKLAASWRNARSTASRRSSSNAGGMHATGNSRRRLPYRRLGARISIHPHPDFWRHGLSAGQTSCSVQGTWTGATYLRSAVRRFNPGPFAPPHGGLGRQAPRTSDTRRRGSPRDPRCREGRSPPTRTKPFYPGLCGLASECSGALRTPCDCLLKER